MEVNDQGPAQERRLCRTQPSGMTGMDKVTVIGGAGRRFLHERPEDLMADASPKQMAIPSDLTEAWNAQQQIMDEVKAVGYSDNAVFAIRLALDEALNNAISHGNQRDPSKKVVIEYTISRQEVQINVTDQGVGFDPKDVPDPTLDEFLERPHGRGIMLMRAYMTQVSFSNRGRTVTLVKDRNCPLPAAPSAR